MTSLNAPPEMRPASLMHAISAEDLTARNSCNLVARGLYRSSSVRNGRYRDTFPKNRGRGRISWDIEPDMVGKET
jgi:hypothetical protein